MIPGRHKILISTQVNVCSHNNNYEASNKLHVRAGIQTLTYYDKLEQHLGFYISFQYLVLTIGRLCGVH